MKVKTTSPKHDDDYTEEARKKRRWGVTGVIVGKHDSHGLCFDVLHDDGEIATYDPDELEIHNVAITNKELFATKNHDQLLQMLKDLEHAISQRKIAFTKKASSLVQPDDEVEIIPDYMFDDRCRSVGIVKELLGNSIHVPGLDHNEFGCTPYYEGISKIRRNGKLIFDRNKIGVRK